MDVKTAFHRGNLSKDVCMTKPGVFTPRNGNKVCKLQRSICELKQASRSWNIRFDETVKEFSFSQNSDNPCVYKKISGSAAVFMKTTFHRGNLSKDVCMTKPEVFTPRNGNKVCKLQRSIYELKQASRSWNIRFDETIKEFSFSQNSDEP